MEERTLRVERTAGCYLYRYKKVLQGDTLKETEGKI